MAMWLIKGRTPLPVPSWKYANGAQRDLLFVEAAAEISHATQADRIAKVVVNERTGTVVMGSNIHITPIAISHGDLAIEVLHTPGHTAGMLNFVVNGTDVFTGDTLFKNSVGGVRAPGSTSYEDLKRSIMDVLLTLPPDTVIRPGHTDPTTVADELESAFQDAVGGQASARAAFWLKNGYQRPA